MIVTSQRIKEMQETWTLLFPDVQPPSVQQCALWGLLHDAEAMRKGFVQLASKYQTLGGEMTATHMAKFLSSVLRRLSREAK
jgi:hypothetical protein